MYRTLFLIKLYLSRYLKHYYCGMCVKSECCQLELLDTCACQTIKKKSELANKIASIESKVT